MLVRRVVIEGRVQGVWFRGWTEMTARRLGLSGWVRNRSDGSVEALFAGDDQAVETMITACHLGPPAALVRAVLVSSGLPPTRPGFHVVG